MSYILDALKKAEQERGSAQLQTVTSGHDGRTLYRNRWWPIAVAIAICAVALICFLLLFPNRTRQGDAPSPAAAKPIDRGVAMPQAPEAAPAAVIPAKTSSPRPIAAPLTENQRIPERSVENRNYSSAPRPVPVIPKPLEQGNPAHDRSAVSPPAETPPSAEKTESVPAPLRDAIKKMTLTVLLYSEIPSERMVFINGRKYREGDSVDGYYLLEKISMEGAELSYKEERLVLRP